MEQNAQINRLVHTLQQEGIALRLQEPLAEHCTFRIGGPAAVLAQPASEAQLLRVLELVRHSKLPYYLLGNGSNILFADQGFAGVVVSLTGLDGPVVCEQNRLTVRAGVKLASLCCEALRHGLTGLEFAYGIPGTVGGAVYMNAGAYGGEIKDVLESVRCLTKEGEVVQLPASELELGYRHSIFERNGACILSAVFCLQPGDTGAIRSRMQELMAQRVQKQPLDKPSAGSTFKRPAGAYASALIDQCGLRGYRHGGAAVSEKHCGFVVNLGGASCADVLALCEEVKGIVQQKTGFCLEKEIRVVGG